jgi:hypothetical protein
MSSSENEDSASDMSGSDAPAPRVPLDRKLAAFADPSFDPMESSVAELFSLCFCGLLFPVQRVTMLAIFFCF